MKLSDKLKELGISNIDELPKKTQIKFEEYRKIVNNPGFYQDKNTGDWKEKTKAKLIGLQEDIITEAMMYLEDKKAKEEEEKKAQEAADEKKAQDEAAGSETSADEKKDETTTIADEKKPTEETTADDKKPKEAATADNKKQRNSWTDWFWPF